MTKYLASGLLLTFLAGAAPVFASDGVKMESKSQSTKTINVACLQTAVDKRDTALITGQDTLHTSIVAALTARKTALQDAWGKTDPKERRTALKNAWATYTKSRRSAQEAWRKERKTAWKTFRTDTKSCGSTTSTDATSESIDNDL